MSSMKKKMMKLSKNLHDLPRVSFDVNFKSKFKIKNVENVENMSHLRWTLDMNEDLILIRKIVSKMKKRPILMNDVLDLFSKEPELISINEHLAKSGGTKI